MAVTPFAEATQSELWNGPSGNAWVENQELLDRLLAPFASLLLEALPPRSSARVLDVGCGTGATTLAVARHVGAECVGIDISAPMLEVARARAGSEGVPARFVCADAQSYDFGPECFDALVSRFGVMFFDRPGAAFANLRGATRANGTLRFIAWRGPEENPYMTTAERAAAPFLPGLPPRRPDAPGQFAFASPLRIRQVLEEGGWGEIDIRPLDVPCAFPEDELLTYVTRLGPVGAMLESADAATRARVIAALRPAFDPYVRDGQVRFTAACWCVDARA